MIDHTLDTGTWRRGKALVAWNFDLRRDAGEDRFATMRRASAGVVRCLTGFARPNRLKWTTRSGGENVATLVAHDITVERVDELGARYPDVDRVLLGLDLQCVAADGVTELTLIDHARIIVNLEDDVPGDDWAVYAAFAIDTDIYAARTLAPNAENRALAAVNGPRLRRFLTCLRDTLGAELYDLEPGAYHGQVGALGFEPPTEPR